MAETTRTKLNVLEEGNPLAINYSLQLCFLFKELKTWLSYSVILSAIDSAVQTHEMK